MLFVRNILSIFFEFIHWKIQITLSKKYIILQYYIIIASHVKVKIYSEAFSQVKSYLFIVHVQVLSNCELFSINLHLMFIL